MPIEYDRRFDEKLMAFEAFAKDISAIKRPCPEAFLDISSKLGISTVIFTDSEYGARHTYSLLGVNELNPISESWASLSVTVWDPIIGFVSKPRDGTSARSAKDESLYLRAMKKINGVDRGLVLLPGTNTFDDFARFDQEVQFYVSPPLAESLQFEKKGAEPKFEMYLRIFEALRQKYGMLKLPIGPVQDLSRKMYSCLYYNLFYAMHDNLRDPNKESKLDRKSIEKFIAKELLS